jgi:hypothetical protein
VFQLAGLDDTRVEKFRLVVGNEGNQQRTGGTARNLAWYTPREFTETIATGVDEEQIRKLSPQDRDDFLKEAGNVMEILGYGY